MPLSDVGRDVLYGIRLVRRRPAYSLVIVGVLAVGIAANLIAFGLFKAVALAPLAGVARSGSLLFVGARLVTGQLLPLSYPEYTQIRDTGFDGLAAWGLQPLILTHRGTARLSQTELVTGNYFDVLGVRAQLGRTIATSDVTRTEQHAVVVLSDGVWRSVFGRDPAIVGATVRINNRPFTVIGVAAPSFRGGIVGLATDLFVPITMQPALAGQDALDVAGDRWVHAFMRPGADRRAQLEARAAQAGAGVAAAYPEALLRERAAIVPLWQWPYGAQSFLLPASALMGATAILLLTVVSANVAGLVLVRSLARRGETAARFALGATRGRVMRQLTIESLVLVVPAAIIGFVVPGTQESFLGAAAANVSLPLYFNTAPDRLVIEVTMLLAAASAVIYGIVPALRLAHVDTAAVLKDSHAAGGARTGRFRTALVGAQIAVAVVLLVGTALVLRTLEAAQHASAGFDPRGITWAGFDARAGGYDELQGRRLYERLLAAIETETGSSAALSAFLPLSLIDWMNWNVAVDGYQPRRDELMGFAVNIVSRGYFRTLGIPLVAGREFDHTDTPQRDAPLVVNETFARRFWGSPAAAIGKGVETGGRHATVVGVARDVKYARLDESPRPYVYAPATHFYSSAMTLQVRGGDTAAALARIRAQAAALDPAMTVLQSGTMAATLKAATSVYETLARMLTLIGVLAVGVSALGVYGLVAYAVKQQAQEISVRAALGASRSSIVGHFLRHGAMLALSGAALGVAAAFAVSRLMTQMLFGVAATDLTSFTSATLVVVSAALLASVVPAWRAANADPIAALRHQ